MNEIHASSQIEFLDSVPGGGRIGPVTHSPGWGSCPPRWRLHCLPRQNGFRQQPPSQMSPACSREVLMSSLVIAGYGPAPDWCLFWDVTRDAVIEGVETRWDVPPVKEWTASTGSCVGWESSWGRGERRREDPGVGVRRARGGVTKEQMENHPAPSPPMFRKYLIPAFSCYL